MHPRCSLQFRDASSRISTFLCTALRCCFDCIPKKSIRRKIVRNGKEERKCTHWDCEIRGGAGRTMENFRITPGFCPNCGSILPPLRIHGNVLCYNCKEEFPPQVFGDMEVEYTIHFNSYDSEKAKKNVKEELSEADGPIVERLCPKCGNDKMSYATLQLRSADEGQTVFFTCTKCKHKESENS